MNRPFLSLSGILFVALLAASCASLSKPGAAFTRHQLTMKTLTTTDYQLFSPAPTDIAFTIDLPAEWKVDHSIVLDAQGRKIAEFSPGFVQGPADVFGLLAGKGNREVGPDAESELISKERLSVGGRRGVKVSKTASVRGSLEGPARITVDVYYLELSKYTFVMAFQYTTNRPSDDTVRRILESVRL